jgi:CP family cyanate transporter-like MFS transporter
MSGTTAVRARTGVLLLGVLLVGANLRVAITPVGPVIGDVRHDLGLSASAASALISLPLLAFALVSPVAPGLARRVGLQRTLVLALVVLAASIVVRSLPWGPGLWIGTVGLGVAIAVLNVVLPSLVKREFPDRLGQTTGLYSAVQSAAAALAAGFAVPLAGLVASGWRLSLGVWAALAVVAVVVIVATTRSSSEAPDPDDVPGPVIGAPRGRSPWGAALAWQVTVFMGLQSTVFYVVITWLPSLEESRGVSADSAGFHQLLLNGFAIVGSLVTSRVVHVRHDQRAIAAAATLLVAAGLAVVVTVPALAAIGVSIAGIGVGGAIVLALSLFGLRTDDHGQAARLSGMAQGIGYLLAAAGPVLIGALHDGTGSWDIAIGVLFPLLGVQLVAGLLAARDRTLR